MLILTKLSFWKEDWTLCYSSMKFWYFPDISHFPKILNLSSFCNLFTTFINNKNHASFHLFTAWKVSKYGVFSGLHFPVFGLNTEIYGVNLRIQSEYRKTRTRNNSVIQHILAGATSCLSPDLIKCDSGYLHNYCALENLSRWYSWIRLAWKTRG